jgi:DNA repair protein Rad18
MFEVDDPSDFKAMELQTLDEHLRCPICKEFFSTPMILSSCSHSFCALCIRRSLTAEQICPKCRAPSLEKDLHNNYDLDNVVQIWKQARYFFNINKKRESNS